MTTEPWLQRPNCLPSELQTTAPSLEQDEPLLDEPELVPELGAADGAAADEGAAAAEEGAA